MMIPPIRAQIIEKFDINDLLVTDQMQFDNQLLQQMNGMISASEGVGFSSIIHVNGQKSHRLLTLSPFLSPVTVVNQYNLGFINIYGKTATDSQLEGGAQPLHYFKYQNSDMFVAIGEGNRLVIGRFSTPNLLANIPKNLVMWT